MRFGSMFITAVCVLFLLKLRWPRKESVYDSVIWELIPHDYSTHGFPYFCFHFNSNKLVVYHHELHNYLPSHYYSLNVSKACGERRLNWLLYIFCNLQCLFGKVPCFAAMFIYSAEKRQEKIYHSSAVSFFNRLTEERSVSNHG